MLPRGAPGTEIGKHLQTVGQEIGVTTGRKRRCGWLDVVVLQYSNLINGYAGLNITKLDCLDELDEIKLGVAYELDGKLLPRGQMPARLQDLERVKVVYETIKGWKTSICKCKSYRDLPENAKLYIKRIEELVQVPVSWIGNGPDREAMLMKE